MFFETDAVAVASKAECAQLCLEHEDDCKYSIYSATNLCWMILYRDWITFKQEEDNSIFIVHNKTAFTA